MVVPIGCIYTSDDNIALTIVMRPEGAGDGSSCYYY